MTDLDDAGNHYAPQAGIPSNGYWYGHRQVLEWKGGEREWIDGNIFDGSFADVNHAGPFDVTAHAGSSYGITDMDVTNNTIQHYPMAMGTIVNVMDNNGHNPPFTDLRFRADNNLMWDIDGFVYSTSDLIVWGVGAIGEGSFLSASGGPGEDFIFDHNTIYDMNGMSDQFWDSRNGPIEGVQITNNILPYSIGASGQDLYFESYASLNSAACSGNSNNEPGTDCSLIAGVGHPDMIFAGNLLIPGWTKSQYPAGGSQLSLSTIQGDWPNYISQNTLLSDNSGGVPASLASIGWFRRSFTAGLFDANGNYDGPVPDFHLQSTSPYGHGSTTDGRPVGADINALEAAQGKVTLVGVPASSITSNAAIIAFVAPDAQGCPVDYSATDPALVTNFTRVQD
ncbi:MAG: hypothetical protein ACRD4O_05080, partial [Bryobacteraceae bacterium]